MHRIVRILLSLMPNTERRGRSVSLSNSRNVLRFESEAYRDIKFHAAFYLWTDTFTFCDSKKFIYLSLCAFLSLYCASAYVGSTHGHLAYLV